MDTGEILTQEKTRIEEMDDAGTLHDRLAHIGATLLVRTIHEHVAGLIQPRPQPLAGVSMAPKIKKTDGRLDWTQPAPVLRNRVRGLAPWPGAFTFLPEQPQPHLLKIWHVEIEDASGSAGEVLQADKTGLIVACGRQALRITSLQREGGKRLAAADFLAGHPLQPGLHFV
jgi:methionyl-tRNA formyltransferase